MSSPPSSKRRKATHFTSVKRRKEFHDAKSEFRIVNASFVLSVPPMFAVNPLLGVQEMLDSMVMRYNYSLQGVVLSHSNIIFTEKIARIKGDCPFLVCRITFDATLWSPWIGDTLCGKVNLCSPDHISLLVHKTFNVSIPKYHIPTDIWEFEYGPAENDPEFGQTSHEGDVDDFQDVANNGSAGRWVHRTTGEVLGGDKSLQEFTVIGLTVANEMLSLLGSLQPDPFSPRHIPHPQKETDEENKDPDSDEAYGNSSSSEEDEEDMLL